MKTCSFRTLILSLILFTTSCQKQNEQKAFAPQDYRPLQQNFQNPSNVSGVNCLWWLNGNVNEAKRLGLEIGFNIQSAWNLGGPRVTPKYAAKQLTYSEIKNQVGQLSQNDNKSKTYGTKNS